MKLLVETTGPFMLHDFFGRQEVAANRPSVVEASPFILDRIGTKIKKLDVLADEASDDTLAVAKRKGPEALKAAVAALPRPAEDEAPPVKPTARKAR